MRKKVIKNNELNEKEMEEIYKMCNKYELDLKKVDQKTLQKDKKYLVELLHNSLLDLYKYKKRDIDSQIVDISILKKAIEFQDFELHFRKTMTIKQMCFLVLFKDTFNISKTCIKMRENRRNFYNWRESYTDFDYEFLNIKEEIIDEVEENFLNNCKTNIIGQMFFLKTQAKARGYIEKTEVESTIKVEAFDFEEI